MPKIHSSRLLSRIHDAGPPCVMGILNVTPDSFSDGGQFNTLDHALNHTQAMINAGVDIIDIGGESTRPGAHYVSTQQELDRVMPVIEAIVKRFEVSISVDTNKPEVMRHAVQAGAAMINDIRALSAPNAIETVRQLGVPVCLMHMQGQPSTMQQAPSYIDVVREVKDFFHERITACRSAGILKENLIIDPGFGFGKELVHNLVLLDNLKELNEWGIPMLVGLSRKAMLGQLLGKPPRERSAGSLACMVIALYHGARIVRVHDVEDAQDATKIVHAVLTERNINE